MCEIKDSYTDSETFTGYKVVYQDKYGHYISPFTGYRYKKGKITNPKFYSELKSTYRQSGFVIDHRSSMIGKTGVLKSKIGAKYTLDDFKDTNNKYCVLEMTITGDLVNGEYADMSTIIGNEIVSFKKIKI